MILQLLRFSRPLSPVITTLIASHIFTPHELLDACQSSCHVTTDGGLTDVSVSQERIKGPVRPSNSLFSILLNQALTERPEKY